MDFESVQDVLAQYDEFYGLSEKVKYLPSGAGAGVVSSPHAPDRIPTSTWVTDGIFRDVRHQHKAKGSTLVLQGIFGATYALRHCIVRYNGQQYSYIDSICVWPDVDLVELDLEIGFICTFAKVMAA